MVPLAADLKSAGHERYAFPNLLLVETISFASGIQSLRMGFVAL